MGLRLKHLIINKRNLLAIHLPILLVGGLAFLMVLMDVLLPYTSAYADVIPAYLVYLGFFTLVFFVYSMLAIGFEVSYPTVVSPVRSLAPDMLRAMEKCMTLACLLSVASMVALIIDRMVYQHVDFLNQSFVEIRSHLNSTRDPGSEVSSLFSVFGNLFQFSYFFTFICLVYFYEKLSRLRCFVYLASIVFFLLAGSYILGGRTIIGLFFLTILAMLMARAVSGCLAVRKLFTFRVLVGLVLLFVSFVLVVSYVFYARASINGLDSATYLLNFASHLRGRPVVNSDVCEGIVCDVNNYLQLSGIYVTHVFWVLAETLASPDPEPQGSPLFGGVLVILTKVIGPLNGEYRFSGLFNSLPGAIYYQYGGLGMVLGAMLVGASFAFAVNWLRRRYSLLSVLFFYLLLMVLLVAPVLSAFNLMVFVFVIFSTGFVAVLYLVRISMLKRVVVV